MIQQPLAPFFLLLLSVFTSTLVATTFYRLTATLSNSPTNRDSLLTAEWIQTGDHADSEVKGFVVEFRPERSGDWQLHPGYIPYKGPNHQYRVQISKLPPGISYLVRIKVISDNNEVLVETPEIRAHNEIFVHGEI